MANSFVDPRAALTAFLVLTLAALVLLWPRVGVVARLLRRLRLTDRVLTEDALKLLFHATHPVHPDDLSRRLDLPRHRLERVLGRLVASGLITTDAELVALSERGRDYATHIVRAHRLWERYLADRTGVPIGRWHEEADAKEHSLSREETERLYERMGRPPFDPHGDPIPEEGAAVPAVDGMPLGQLEAGRAAEIIHLEDEPDASYQRLLAAGLSVGDRLSVSASDGAGVRVRVSGRDVQLEPADAAGVTVRPVVDATAGTQLPTLADIAPGATAVVAGLAPACHGPERRRLLDLGIVPDTEITAEFTSALGEPMAFRIRGALIALRRHQARWVLIRPGSAGERRAA
jgi:DtxR family Mn-dependent transcriptional regulator